MASSGDPFRTLGLPPGASEAEIKRAYRALAKRYHPDSGGEGALARFLAIQAAYDMLTTPGGRSRARPSGSGRGTAGPAGGPGSRGGAGSADAGSRTSEADAERARATRDAYRARRSRPGPAAGPAGGPAWWSAGREGSAAPGAGSRPGTRGGSAPGQGGQRSSAGAGEAGTPGTGPTGAAGAGASAAGSGAGHSGSSAGHSGSGAPGGSGRTSGGAEARRRRAPRVATLGSTSYDDAPHEPEPEWAGATWYGDNSGTYWTINPKEYADPRKHGPEYLARARRRTAAGTPDGFAGGDPVRGAGATAPGATADGADADGADAAGAAAAGAAGASGATASDARRTASADDTGVPGDAPRVRPDGGGDAPRPGVPRAASRRERVASWTAEAAASTGAEGFRNTAGAPGRSGRAGADAPFGRTAADSSVNDLDAPTFDAGFTQRVVLALIAWPPIGLAAAQLLGDLTGCDRYAASCSQPASLLGWLAQPVVVAVLLLLPRLAQVAAVASLVVGVAALGGAAVLSSMGGTRAPAAASSLLLAILVMAYAVGLIGALSGRVPLPPWLSGRR